MLGNETQLQVNICRVAEVEMLFRKKDTFPALPTINMVEIPLFGNLAGHSDLLELKNDESSVLSAG